jgi:predicted RNA binding protein YcfA (HicA-like mRNA interferase family)
VKGFYDLVVAALREHGFVYWKQGKGSHEKWRKGEIRVLVPFNCESRHTANAVMKAAGIDKHF